MALERIQLPGIVIDGMRVILKKKLLKVDINAKTIDKNLKLVSRKILKKINKININ